MSIFCAVQVRYDSTPGTASTIKNSWPSNCKIVRSVKTKTLVMVLHPHCPCSRASLQQVASIMNSKNSPKCLLLFYTPSSFAKDWEKTDLWNQALEISGAELISDIDGIEAQKFGGITSGQTYIFDKAGILNFSGGITIARGHSGECANLAIAKNALEDKFAVSNVTPVYGCPIIESREHAQL